jgi:uncharacterized membrane protein YhaH (DUF805 family)
MFDALKKYAGFTGRATRKEFWLFMLFCFIVGYVAKSIDQYIYDTVYAYSYFYISGIVGLVLICPFVAVNIRRLHDTNRSGWWLLLLIVPLLGFVNLYFYLKRGTSGSNRFGKNPLSKSKSATRSQATSKAMKKTKSKAKAKAKKKTKTRTRAKKKS